MRFLKQLKTLALILAFTLTAKSANAISVFEYSGVSSVGVAVELTSTGVFQTTGGAALSSLLSNWAPIVGLPNSVGKIKITGVNLTGNAVNQFGSFIQATTGGLIEALDAANNVLLSATFTNGVLSMAGNGAGSQLTIGLATFGGQYASLFVPTSATHAISFISWSAVGIGQNGSLIAGNGVGNGLVSGTQETVPEPATMLLLGSGLLGAAVKKKRA
jgi:hypothetical protein